MKARLYVVLCLVLGSLAMTALPSLADPIGPNCGTCQGSIYTLQYALESTSGGNSTYDITYTIDTTGYNGGGTNLDSAAVKVVSQFPSALELDSAPGGTSNWSVMDGGISAAGCDGSGNGFVCSSATATGGVGAYDAVGGTLVWIFDVTVPTGSLITSSFGASIKARYVDSSDNKVGGLVSEDITLQPGTPPPPPPPVPEPVSLLLFGSGFAVMLAKKGLSKV